MVFLQVGLRLSCIESVHLVLGALIKNLECSVAVYHFEIALLEQEFLNVS